MTIGTLVTKIVSLHIYYYFLKLFLKPEAIRLTKNTSRILHFCGKHREGSVEMGTIEMGSIEMGSIEMEEYK